MSKFSNAFHHQSKYDKECVGKTLNSSSTQSIGENSISKVQSSSSDTAFNGTNSASYNHLPDILGFSRQQQLKLNSNNVISLFLFLNYYVKHLKINKLFKKIIISYLIFLIYIFKAIQENELFSFS